MSMMLPGFKGCHCYRRSCILAFPFMTSLGFCTLFLNNYIGLYLAWNYDYIFFFNSTRKAIPTTVHRITGEHSGKNYSPSDTVTQASPKRSGFCSPLSKSYHMLANFLILFIPVNSNNFHHFKGEAA